MTAIILLPENNGGYEFAKIYRSDSSDGEYTLIDTIDSDQLEYEDSDGDYTSYYQIAWYDGTTESNKIPVQSTIQKVIDIIRIECKLTSAVLSDQEIYFLIDEVRRLIQIDICTYHYGRQIYKIKDDYYELPGAFYFDHNVGGVVSKLDVEFFKQATPLYAFTTKESVIIEAIDFDDFWVKVSGVENTDILKINYYTVNYKLDSKVLNQLIAYKISAIYFENLAANSISTTITNPYSKVKIGPISVENGTSTSIGTNINAINDFANKMNAKYDKLVSKFKTRFRRVN